MKETTKVEILDQDDLVPPTYDITPGWVDRNRTLVETSRRISRALMVVSPPPARIALGVVSVAADALLLADEYGRKRGDLKEGALSGAGIALEGLALIASSKLAPARLAASLTGIEAARSALDRLRTKAV